MVKRIPALVWIRLVFCSLALLFATVQAVGQPSTPPSNSLCRQWDEAYLATFRLFLWALIGLVIATTIVLPILLGKRWWLMTRPILRVFIIGATLAAIALSVTIVLPEVGSYGWLGANSAYPECSGRRFGAIGPLYGYLNKDIAAYDQRPYLAGLLFIAAILGSGLSLLLGGLIRARWGLFAQVKEEKS